MVAYIVILLLLAGCYGASSQPAEGKDRVSAEQQAEGAERQDPGQPDDRQRTGQPDAPAAPDESDNAEQGGKPAVESGEGEVMESGDEQEDDAWKEKTAGLSDEEIELLELMFGRWAHEEQPDMILKLGYGTELVGVENGQVLAYAEYEISEINREEQSIVIDGMRENISFGEGEAERVNYTSKILLQEGGSTLLYIYDYPGEKIESLWIRVQ